MSVDSSSSTSRNVHDTLYQVDPIMPRTYVCDDTPFSPRLFSEAFLLSRGCRRLRLGLGRCHPSLSLGGSSKIIEECRVVLQLFLYLHSTKH